MTAHQHLVAGLMVLGGGFLLIWTSALIVGTIRFLRWRAKERVEIEHQRMVFAENRVSILDRTLRRQHAAFLVAEALTSSAVRAAQELKRGSGP